MIPNNQTVSNSSVQADSGFKIIFYQAVGYISLMNLIFGVIGNIICFTVFVFTRELRNMSFVVYLTYCSLSNILSLFEWNFNHYLKPIHGIQLEMLSITGCRLVSFLQYFSLQCSSYFLSWMCIDRFVSVIAMPGSFASRLPFSTAKSAHFWSIFTILIIFGLNSHILILNGYYDPPEWRNITIGSGVNKTIVSYLYQNPDYQCGRYSETFNLWPLWDVIHVYVNTVIPFCIMITFNLLLIVKTLMPKKTSVRSSVNNNKISQDKSRLTRSLIVITLSFLIMTVPAGVAFGYFASEFGKFPWLFSLLDSFAFAHQSALFINCYTTNNKFRLRITNFINMVCIFLRIRKPGQILSSTSIELSLQRTNHQTKTSV